MEQDGAGAPMWVLLPPPCPVIPRELSPPSPSGLALWPLQLQLGLSQAHSACSRLRPHPRSPGQSPRRRLPLPSSQDMFSSLNRPLPEPFPPLHEPAAQGRTEAWPPWGLPASAPRQLASALLRALSCPAAWWSQAGLAVYFTGSSAK